MNHSPADPALFHVPPPGPVDPDALASGAVVSGRLVHATVIPRREDGSIETGGIREQSEQIFTALEAVLARSGSALDKLVHLTIYLTDIEGGGHRRRGTLNTDQA